MDVVATAGAVVVPPDEETLTPHPTMILISKIRHASTIVFINPTSGLL
jgi:hypothetical protein